jgi:hypothetical protein
MPPSCPDGGSEQGSALVEFTFLSLLLMVPLVYIMITVAVVQYVRRLTIPVLDFQ